MSVRLSYHKSHRIVVSQLCFTVTMTFKGILVLCCLAAAVLASDKYTDKYDNIDIDEILSNRRLLISYFNCMMDKGKCTPEGKELREHIGDALETGCEKCTEAQVDGTAKIIEHLIKNEREYWKELCAKYDPDGVWRKKYEDRAKEKGIVIPED